MFGSKFVDGFSKWLVQVFWFFCQSGLEIPLVLKFVFGLPNCSRPLFLSILGSRKVLLVLRNLSFKEVVLRLVTLLVFLETRFWFKMFGFLLVLR